MFLPGLLLTVCELRGGPGSCRPRLCSKSKRVERCDRLGARTVEGVIGPSGPDPHVLWGSGVKALSIALAVAICSVERNKMVTAAQAQSSCGDAGPKVDAKVQAHAVRLKHSSEVPDKISVGMLFDSVVGQYGLRAHIGNAENAAAVAPNRNVELQLSPSLGAAPTQCSS